MLPNGHYDKIKILYKLSQLCWFIKKHAIENAEEENKPNQIEILQNLVTDLDKYIQKIEKEF